MADSRVSIVIPVYDEGDAILPCLERIAETVTLPHEVLVVHDTDDDTTIPFIDTVASANPSVRRVRNTLGRGPAYALRAGFDAADAPVVVVTMADGCDDPGMIDEMVRLVERGCVIVAASRYMPTGAQVGGPWFKSTLSKWAGISLHVLARVGTHDATNSFKAYDRDFVQSVGISSESGFEMGIELVAKARRCRRPVAELPTIWLDRAFGESNFKLRAWLPRYLRWYRFAFGGPLTPEQVRQEGNPT